MRPDLTLDDAALLAGCDVDTYRGTGPGGQKRNKTESAVRLRHRDTGLMASDDTSRSQAENRARALKRLRKQFALRLREPVASEGIPSAIATCIDSSKGRLSVGQRDSRYLPALALVLDILASHQGSLSDAATQLGITTANLSSFLTGDEDAYVETNRLRSQYGLRPLRRD